ncbi:hypothetical protein [uncultured Roseobacter sp.]|uniref:DUF7007 domain-containing protein n=1 Tax=uncultured Roseobacter sp. TaxID=114847 RepID=UPI0026198A2F|nr:hypothetical protein [uncultured Roseobacter sp.]
MITPKINDVSPWGIIETCTYIADGITAVSTLSHGGLHLSLWRLQAVPMEWRMARQAPRNTLECPWFEEDCEGCMVVLSFLHFFKDEQREYAAIMQENWLRPALLGAEMVS